jgi:hypothetical protein
VAPTGARGCSSTSKNDCRAAPVDRAARRPRSPPRDSPAAPRESSSARGELCIGNVGGIHEEAVDIDAMDGRESPVARMAPGRSGRPSRTRRRGSTACREARCRVGRRDWESSGRSPCRRPRLRRVAARRCPYRDQLAVAASTAGIEAASSRLPAPPCGLCGFRARHRRRLAIVRWKALQG